MKLPPFFLSAACFFYSCQTKNPTNDKRNKANDIHLDAMQIIRKYGYPAEAYTIETEDGYLLQMHRIPHGKTGSLLDEPLDRPAILIQHGLLCSSAGFLLLGPDKSLPFLLADLGFDVWLGNVRGNVYSRAHASLDPDEIAFWNFTWHESGMFDISAEIDFVRDQTRQKKITYLAHSMGTTMFFVLMSSKPEYNEKIKFSLLMAPVAYLKNNRSPLMNFLAPISNQFYALFKLLGEGEFFPESEIFKFFARHMCEKNRIKVKLCFSIIYLIVGSDPNEYDENLLNLLIGHFPAGYSMKGVNHYAQLIRSGKFRQYDYGTSGNQLEYGFPVPPKYKLENIKVPMNFYVGLNDFISTLLDVKRLAKRLPTLRNLTVVEYPNFSHLDFLFSNNVKAQLYDKIIHDMKVFFNEQVNGEMK